MASKPVTQGSEALAVTLSHLPKNMLIDLVITRAKSCGYASDEEVCAAVDEWLGKIHKRTKRRSKVEKGSRRPTMSYLLQRFHDLQAKARA